MSLERPGALNQHSASVQFGNLTPLQGTWVQVPGLTQPSSSVRYVICAQWKVKGNNITTIGFIYRIKARR